MAEELNKTLAELLLRWEESFEHGNELSSAELCKDHPDLTEELQTKIDDLKQMAWMTKDGETATQNDEPDDLISTTLGGRYRIESLIAAGGFGRVYQAFDPELERHVAVKLPSRNAESNGQVDALVEEARKVAKLRHPGIVAVHDVGKDDDRCFIVSDLIKGRSLADLISDDRPSVTESTLLLAQVAENLQAAHDEGFIHRDIKPANILIDESSRPLLTDFGIATTSGSDVLNTTATSGTLAYMSPEQVAGEAQLIDARSDIYSLGVVLYELLTGQSPYQARTPGKMREQILFRQPTPINDAVPKPVSAVCMKCLAKHPADRYSSATKLATALRSSLTERPSSTSWKWALMVVGLISLTAVAFAAGKHVGQAHTTVAVPTEKTAFVFDGSSRIVTPLERFAPVTLEAWIRPDRFRSEGCHFIIGSDVPGEFGIGIGMCPVQLSTELIPNGVCVSSHPVPIRTWTHIAAVFGETETRVFCNGHHVHTAPPTENEGGTTFVIGNVGGTNHLDFFIGKIRSLRITRGERYDDDFTPDGQFEADTDAVLIYEGNEANGDNVVDLSGHENHGKWQRFTP